MQQHRHRRAGALFIVEIAAVVAAGGEAVGEEDDVEKKQGHTEVEQDLARLVLVEAPETTRTQSTPSLAFHNSTGHSSTKKEKRKKKKKEKEKRKLSGLALHLIFHLFFTIFVFFYCLIVV